jgi:hypothetical protein
VLVAHHELRLPVADAARYVVDRHDREVRAFIAARDRVGVRPPVAEALECWIRANVDWSRESGRYAPDGGP